MLITTGLFTTPVLPKALTAERSNVPVVHSADYVDAAPYRGREVLVVGAGSSGMVRPGLLGAAGARARRTAAAVASEM